MSILSVLLELGTECAMCPATASRFICDDDGQDIVEYAFLAALIAIVGWAAVMAIDETVADAYDAWQDPDVGVPSLWQPNEPASAGS